jgi:hypothetical protein
MISRQKREDARIAALMEDDEDDDVDGEDNRGTRSSVSSDPGSYKYEEPNVDDVEREVSVVFKMMIQIHFQYPVKRKCSNILIYNESVKFPLDFL